MRHAHTSSGLVDPTESLIQTSTTALPRDAAADRPLNGGINARTDLVVLASYYWDSYRGDPHQGDVRPHD
jgi:hypothetical protein